MNIQTAGEIALSRIKFKGEIKKHRSEHKCKECGYRLLCENGQWYHLLTRIPCSLLAKYDEAKGKHFDVKTTWGREQAWYVQVD